MSDQQPYHDMLDDVALYALGTLPAADAQRVRDHIATCAECRAEYAGAGPGGRIGRRLGGDARGAERLPEHAA